jgi:hypothetical protein
MTLGRLLCGSCLAVLPLLPLACGDDGSRGNPGSGAGDAGEAGAGDASGGAGGSDGSGGSNARAGETGSAGDSNVGGGDGEGGGGSQLVCTPRDDLEKPVTTALLVQPTCQPVLPCGGDIEATEWAYSGVCLDQDEIFAPIYEECPTSQLNGPADISVIGSLRFEGGTVMHDATLSGTGVFQIPVACTNLDCKGQQEVFKNNGAGPNTFCYEDVYPDLSCRCLIDFEVTVTEAQTYTVDEGTLRLRDGTEYAFCATDGHLGLSETSPLPSLPGSVSLIPAAATSTPEICDGLDNDKDGVADNDPLDCPTMACNDSGVCAGVQPVCGGSWYCDYTVVPNYEPGDETTCDAFDNDCDGEVDEGLVDCYEKCDGLDNDNNGTIDDDPQDSPCGLAKLGVCATGVTATCLGEAGWQCEFDATDFEAEETTCGDAKDNDCDGQVDEGCSCPFGKSQMFVVQWGNTPALLRADLDGQNAAPVPALSGFALTNIAVDSKNNKLYFGDGSNKIQRSNLDGSGIEVLWTGMSQTWAVNVANGLLIGECNTSNICRLNTPNTTTTLVTPASATWVNVDPVNQVVWWADHAAGYEWNFIRANFDGTGVTGIGASQLSAPLNFEIDSAGQKIYWQKGQAIWEVGTDGSDEREVTPLTNSYVYDMAVDHTGAKIYFTEVNGSQVRRVGVNGLDNELLIPNVTYSVAIDLYLCP